jgi:hypothetical protein
MAARGIDLICGDSERQNSRSRHASSPTAPSSSGSIESHAEWPALDALSPNPPMKPKLPAPVCGAVLRFGFLGIVTDQGAWKKSLAAKVIRRRLA